MIRLFLSMLMLLAVHGCTGLPDAVTPVDDFDVNRYLGTWYEIARLDHSFERGLVKVTAEYSMREDGGLNVINRGYSSKSGEWKQAEGKAFFVDTPDTGHLKVSFFGPFYGSYVVFDLDKTGYQYAYVAGYNKSYLWLLARKPDIDPEQIERFVNKARDLGFDSDALVFVEHDAAAPSRLPN